MQLAIAQKTVRTATAAEERQAGRLQVHWHEVSQEEQRRLDVPGINKSQNAQSKAKRNKQAEPCMLELIRFAGG